MSHKPALLTEPKAPAARVPAPAADAAPDYHGTLATLVGLTLERYLMRKQTKFPYATGEPETQRGLPPQTLVQAPAPSALAGFLRKFGRF